MSVIQRGIIFSIGTVANVILFLFHSRVVLEIVGIANQFPSGPATPAIESIPMGMQLAMGGLQIGLVVYLVGGLGSQRSVDEVPRR